MRAAWLVLLAACYRPTLGEAPFACESGACPNGYRCASGLCVTRGSPDPPQLLTVVGGRAQPQPVWLEGRLFAVAWSQDTDSEAGGPGLFTQQLSADGLGGRQRIVRNVDDLDFAVLHPPGGDSIVLAVRSNTHGHAELRVFTTRVADALSGDSTLVKELSIGDQRSVPEGYGFSAPSLSARSSNEVMVAVAFTSPPGFVADNAFCATVDIARSDAGYGCRPPVSVTNGTFASEVSIAADPRGWVLFWRDLRVHATGERDGVMLPRVDTMAERLLSPVLLAGKIAAVVRAGDSDAGTTTWGLALATLNATNPDFTPVLTQPGAIVPHLIAAGDRFLGCDLDAQGELVVAALSTTDLARVGRVRTVPRVSKAVIESCHIALAEDGTVAIAWKEQIATRSDVFRVFAALLPPE